MRLERLTAPGSALHLSALLRAHDGTSLEPRNDEDRPWTLAGGTGLDASIITHIPLTAKQISRLSYQGFACLFSKSRLYFALLKALLLEGQLMALTYKLWEGELMTGSTLQVFTNSQFGQIRTITNDGTIMFCGRDVASALGYTNLNKAVQDHCKGVPFRYPLETSGGIQQIRFITEGDVYRLIVSSHLPGAERFEKWVFDEVLPSIRRTGLYAIDELLENDELLEQALTRLRAERVKRLAAEQALLEAAPKLSYYDIVLQSPSLMPITAIAKDYGLSAKKLNRLLADEHIQFKQSGIWYLYAEYAKCGYTQSKTHLLESGKTVMHTYWTQKGRLFIYDLLKNRCQILPVIEREAGETK